ncbi:SAM-dependent methyltransferase [Streptacidiphilus jiangxiensis]|uniref:Methyltransferase small domain-containing protein n=1 Tax=Streptacidiphilus jiangxiensis TaxID=235985 RepID=A0A1H8BAI6_STRJI|nr:SAM-dependent methyltransferase [Streptacidiphilus jiangxiensis]SEM79960.1 Methyltransferase small domain-containing protein [Streptacidiphilus jiangxiensis]
MRITPDVRDVLEKATVDGVRLLLPEQLPDLLYQRVNKVLAAAGGRWNRRAQAHVFAADPSAVIAGIVRTGILTTPQDHGYFPTPPPIVDRLLELADLSPGLRVLEPSAGRGAIASALADKGCIVDCVELLPDNAQALAEAGFQRVTTGDFLTVAPRPQYDRVVMNPPFAKDADAAHVIHAFGFLAPAGLLVAVLSNGVTFHRTPAAKAFRALLQSTGGQLHELPANSFQASGTGTGTVIAVLPGTGRTLSAPAPATDAPADSTGDDLPDPQILVKEIILDLQESLLLLEELRDSLAPAAVRTATTD